jgi:prepilin-type N-terminal cleavage/methylation domain-containing protein
MRAPRGFSLIEAVVAMALLAASLLVLAQLVTAAIMSNVAARKATTALILASQKIEELRSSPALPSYGSDAAGLFVRHWTIDALPASALGTYIIEVRVETAGSAGATTRLIAAARWR